MNTPAAGTGDRPHRSRLTARLNTSIDFQRAGHRLSLNSLTEKKFEAGSSTTTRTLSGLPEKPSQTSLSIKAASSISTKIPLRTADHVRRKPESSVTSSPFNDGDRVVGKCLIGGSDLPRIIEDGGRAEIRRRDARRGQPGAIGGKRRCDEKTTMDNTGGSLVPRQPPLADDQDQSMPGKESC